MRDPKNSNQLDSNHYAFPLSVCPVLNTVTMKVTRIEYLPTGAGWEVKPPQPVRNIEPNEYIPEMNKLRTDLKPLRVIQPEGASFTVTGDIVRWQKWEFRLTFNYREGMVLHEVSYDKRPLFYRVSLSDMTVPYGELYTLQRNHCKYK
jgi:primary-amine oxidase